MDFLEVHPEEFPQLFDTILINVTAFCRDQAPWEYLISEIVPKIVADHGITVSVRKSRGRDIRAACGQLITETTRAQSPGRRLALMMD